MAWKPACDSSWINPGSPTARTGDPAGMWPRSQAAVAAAEPSTCSGVAGKPMEARRAAMADRCRVALLVTY